MRIVGEYPDRTLITVLTPGSRTVASPWIHYMMLPQQSWVKPSSLPSRDVMSDASPNSEDVFSAGVDMPLELADPRIGQMLCGCPI